MGKCAGYQAAISCSMLNAKCFDVITQAPTFFPISQTESNLCGKIHALSCLSTTIRNRTRSNRSTRNRTRNDRSSRNHTGSDRNRTLNDRSTRNRIRSDRSTFLPLRQTDILPQRHILGIRIPQHPSNLRTPQTLDPHDFGRRIIHESSAHLQRRHCRIRRLASPVNAILRSRRRPRGRVPFHNDEPYGFLLGELPLHVDDACGEETGFGSEGAVSAMVYVESAVGGEAVEEPEGTVADGEGVGEEAGVKRGVGKSVDVERGY